MFQADMQLKGNLSRYAAGFPSSRYKL